MNTYFIYALCDPRKPGKYNYDGLDFTFDYEPFYIGKGTGKRPMYHIWSSVERRTNPIKANKIKSILDAGFEPTVIKPTIDISNEDSAYELEEHAIRCVGSLYITSINDGPLTNYKIGNNPPNNKGKSYEEIYGDRAEEQRKKRHDAQLAAGGWFKGRKHTEEAKRRQSQPGAKNGKAKAYIFTDPTGIQYTVVGEFMKFCAEHDLSQWSMKKFMKTKINTPATKNWSVEEIDRATIQNL
jgi:hypothetical protein